MALGFNSSPQNWNIDYSQDRRGQIAAQGMVNTASLLGNAVQEFAAEKAKRDRKKAEEDAAVQFIMREQKLTEPEARSAVRGIGGPSKVVQLVQLDQEKKAREVQIEQFKANKAQQDAQLENARQRLLIDQEQMAQLREDRDRAKKDSEISASVLNGALAPPRSIAKNERATPEEIASRITALGGSSKAALDAASKIDNFRHAEVKMQNIGGQQVLTGPGRIVYDRPAKPQPSLVYGMEEDKELNGVKVRAVWTARGWIDKKSGQELYPKDAFGTPRPNPSVWGVDAGDEVPIMHIDPSPQQPGAVGGRFRLIK